MCNVRCTFCANEPSVAVFYVLRVLVLLVLLLLVMGFCWLDLRILGVGFFV